MAEPTSTIPALLVGGVPFATALGFDPLTVIGAGGGAGMFCMMAYWIPHFWLKLGYFLISWIFGYVFAVQVVLPASWSFVSWLNDAPGIKGFFAAFLVVLVCTGLIEFVRTGKLPGWIKELAKLRIRKQGEPDA